MQSPYYRVALLSMLLSMTLVICACGTVPAAPAPKGADVSLLQPCDEAQGSAETNGAMAKYLRSALDALRACNRSILIFKESAK